MMQMNGHRALFKGAGLRFGLLLLAALLCWNALSSLPASSDGPSFILLSSERLTQPGELLAAGQEVDAEALEQQAVYLTNLERVGRGLPPLKQVQALTVAARGHSEDMALNDFFSHIGSDGSTVAQRVSRAGYALWTIAAENIAAGFPTPEEVVRAWLNSPSHRDILLHPQLREIGVGYYYQSNDQGNVRLPEGAVGGPYYHYWTQDFGTRYHVFPVIINNEAPTTTRSSVDLYIYGSGQAQQMMISNWPDFRDAVWQPFASQRVWDLLPGNGERTVYVRLLLSGGITVESWDSIVVRGMPEPTPTPTPTPTPAGPPPMLINGGAEYTNRQAVTLQLNPPANSKSVALANRPDFSDMVLLPVASTVDWQLADGPSGPRTVYGRFVFISGENSPLFSDSIILDAIPPEGWVALVAFPDGHSRLALPADDDYSGVAEMRLGAEADLSGAAWQLYQPSYELPEEMLSAGAGPPTLYVQYRDRAGNESPVYDSGGVLLTPRAFLPVLTFAR